MVKLAFYFLALLFIVSPLHAIRYVTFTYATKNDPVSMDPGIIFESQTHNFLSHIYEGLVARDEQLKIVPALAESWENREPTYWVFHLRRKAKFHNGERLKVDDIVFSYQRFNHSSSDLKTALTSIKSVQKIDDYTIAITTHLPTPTLLEELCALKIMSKAWCEKNKAEAVIKHQKGKKNFADLNACGTGPYELVERKPDVITRLQRHSEWWGAYKGNIYRIIHKPIPNDATRVAGLLSGDFDYIEPVPFQDVERLSENPQLDVVMQPSMNTLYLGFNASAPVKDQRLRRAFAMAIDSAALCQKLFNGQVFPTGLLVANGVQGYDPVSDMKTSFDPEEAKKLLSEAGFPAGLKLDLDVATNRFNRDEEIGQAIASMLAKIGVTIRVNVHPKAKFYQKVMAGQSAFYLSGWMPTSLDIYEPYAGLAMTPGKDGQGGYNFGNYSNPEMDRLLGQIHVEMQTSRRQELIAEMLRLHQQDLPQIPLFQEPQVIAKKKIIVMPMPRRDGVMMLSLMSK